MEILRALEVLSALPATALLEHAAVLKSLALRCSSKKRALDHDARAAAASKKIAVSTRCTAAALETFGALGPLGHFTSCSSPVGARLVAFLEVRALGRCASVAAGINCEDGALRTRIVRFKTAIGKLRRCGELGAFRRLIHAHRDDARVLAVASTRLDKWKQKLNSWLFCASDFVGIDAVGQHHVDIATVECIAQPSERFELSGTDLSMPSCLLSSTYKSTEDVLPGLLGRCPSLRASISHHFLEWHGKGAATWFIFPLADEEWLELRNNDCFGAIPSVRYYIDVAHPELGISRTVPPIFHKTLLLDPPPPPTSGYQYRPLPSHHCGGWRQRDSPL